MKERIVNTLGVGAPIAAVGVSTLGHLNEVLTTISLLIGVTTGGLILWWKIYDRRQEKKRK